MRHLNEKTRVTASTIGILLGLAGIINHGLFEIMQGNIPTGGLFIEAIGEANRFWIHGTEGAFTIILNFLVTGICVVLVSLSLIIWSLKYMHVKHGTTVFLALLILLTLVGGGIGYILLFVPTWAFATRIDRPLEWWKKVLSARMRKALSKLWFYSLVATALSWLTLMELGIFGYFPGQKNPDKILNIVYAFLFTSVILACFTFVCGYAADIEELESNE